MPRPLHLRRSTLQTLSGIVVCLAGISGEARVAAAKEMSPLSSIRDLLGTRNGATEVLLRGAVTYNAHGFIVQDGTGALAVEPVSPTSVALGDEIEVHGTLDMRAGLPVVRDAQVQDLWAGSTPLPLSITPDEAAEGAYNGMLVTIEGRLIKSILGPNGPLRLTIENGNQIFTCVLEEKAPAGAIRYETGSTLRFTGVLSVNQAEAALDGGTFRILLRNDADIHVLVAAPWSTPRHLLSLFLLLMVLVWVGYRIHLRNVQMRMSMVLEERSRIAREIHDTLAQGFAGIALQLHGVTRTMSKQSAATDAHLALALQMVRRSRAEAHRSIATLRTLHSYEDLAGMCERLLRQLTGPAQLVLTVSQHGNPRTLPDGIASQILRITQEAVANTIEHAAAQSVTVTLTFTADALTLQLQDDGSGFDIETVGSPELGHFGITGMRERAASIQAAFSIHSGPYGTTLELKLPLTSTHKGHGRHFLRRSTLSARAEPRSRS